MKHSKQIVNPARFSRDVLDLNRGLGILPSEKIAKGSIPALNRPVVTSESVLGGRIAKKVREPNKTEAEYGRILSSKHPEATIRYEAYTLKLADGCRYIPDWAVEFPDGRLEFHEVKGAFIFARALTKPRTAAELFPQRFVLAQKTKSGWEITSLHGKADAITDGR